MHYEVLRHLLRVSEETMTEVLEEAVRLRLVRRRDDPFTYVPYDDELRAEIAGRWTPNGWRVCASTSSARRRVFE